MAATPHERARRFFESFLAHRAAWTIAVVGLSLVLGFFAARVRPDYAVEYLFPERSEARADYERYKAIYPYEDTRALVLVEAPDIFTPEGLSRVARLEADLGRIERVTDVEGPLSIKDVIDAGEETVKTERLFPRPDLPPAEIERRRVTATADPLFRWQLAPPDGRAVTIRVTLDERGSPEKDLLRGRFLRDLRAVLERHERPGQRLVYTGLPVIRAEYTEMIETDKAKTFALVSIVILLLLYVTFRTWKDVAAAACTIVASVVWTRGAMGLIGYPELVLTSITPTVVMIVSISDTVHILTHYRAALGRGADRRAATIEAMADSAWPCFLTEVTIAAGFLSLYFVDITMISQFGVATACGMILTWLANMTVLPLLIDVLKPLPPVGAFQGRSPAERLFARFVVWIEGQVTRRPGRVVAVAAVILAAAVVSATRMGREYFAFDDLRPGSPIKEKIEFAERTYGGCDPLVVFIEPAAPAAAGTDPMLHPEVIRLADRIAAALEARFPGEVKNALSVADYVKKAHRIFAPEAAAADPIPPSRNLVGQELLFIDDGKILRDYLDFSRRTAAVCVAMPDVGTTRLTRISEELRDILRAEELRMREIGVPVKLTATGMFTIGDDIYRTLVGGLLWSLAGAVAVSFCVFCIVLRSWRLGLLALVPNLAPLAITFGFMGLTGIQLTPTTVIVFSITLVIADDDTVQYFARYRQRFLEVSAAGDPDPHATAALATLREAGLPMFITSCAVSLGFLTLNVSQFLGLAYLGTLIGVSLFAAIFADLFLTPILIMTFKPRLGPPPQSSRPTS